MNKGSRYHQIFKKELATLYQIRKNYRKLIDFHQKVSIITPTRKPDCLENIFANYRRQNYPNKELIIVLNNNQFEVTKWLSYSQNYPNAQIHYFDRPVSLGESLNYGISRATGAYIARFDDDDYYGPEYLTDMLTYFKCTEAAVVGKTCQFVFFTGTNQLFVDRCGAGFDPRSALVNFVPWYRYIDSLTGAGQVVKREVFGQIAYPHQTIAEDRHFSRLCVQQGIRQYAADPFNYVTIRNVNAQSHTWHVDDKEYADDYCIYLADTFNYQAFVRV